MLDLPYRPSATKKSSKRASIFHSFNCFNNSWVTAGVKTCSYVCEQQIMMTKLNLFYIVAKGAENFFLVISHIKRPFYLSDMTETTVLKIHWL